jgi:uncharacterized membrane protein YdcZ (DUF606 family)
VQFDGNPIDMATIVIAILTCFLRPARRLMKKTSPCFSYDKLVVDFLNGTVLVPFFLMVGAIFSKSILDEAVKSNKLFMAIGGVIGLFFVFREYFNGE